MKLVVIGKSSEVPNGQTEPAFQVNIGVFNAKGERMTSHPIQVYPSTAKEYDFWKLNQEYRIPDLEGI